MAIGAAGYVGEFFIYLVDKALHRQSEGPYIARKFSPLKVLNIGLKKEVLLGLRSFLSEKGSTVENQQ